MSIFRNPNLNTHPHKRRCDGSIEKIIYYFNKKIETKKEEDCWLWKGTINNGYGIFYCNGLRIRAHIISYIIFKNEVPKGKEVCHKCDNPSCVNPNHLYLGTHQDNMKDTIGTVKYLKRFGRKGIFKNNKQEINK